MVGGQQKFGVVTLTLRGLTYLVRGSSNGTLPADPDLAAFLKRTTPGSSKPAPWNSMNYYSNTPKFAVSLLKSLYGDAATKQNGFAFDYLPKIDRDYSCTNIWDDMYNGTVKGMMAF